MPDDRADPRIVDAWVRRSLRERYSRVLDEAVPQALLDLLEDDRKLPSR